MSNTKGEKHLFSFQYLFSISSSLWTEDALKKIVEWDVCIVWPPDDIASTLYSTFSCDIFLLSFYVRERVRMFSITGISKNVTWTHLRRNDYPYIKKMYCHWNILLSHMLLRGTRLYKIVQECVYMVFSTLNNIWYSLDWHIIPWQRNESSPC